MTYEWLHHGHTANPIIMDAGTAPSCSHMLCQTVAPPSWIAATERHDARRLGMGRGPAGITELSVNIKKIKAPK